ncbi:MULTISPECIES: hypothetical protein [Streptomyces]|uniref:Uncharacterized protein n=1 Tax=Streptomyces evansiae TaxID=3075535 RepID=A0ABU2REK4_9ACTN|nr:MULTISPECIES: hypothetical protein [unclassified Streptomyces]MDT0413715.1 hypothetical protein [Streptomyces sp. DSM 41979]
MSADHPVLLPSGAEWGAEARLVGEALRTVQSAAAQRADETRFVLPLLRWQIAADWIGDCPGTDHGAGGLRILLLPEWALSAVWDCHRALVRARDGDEEAADLAGLLGLFLDAVHGLELADLVARLEHVLAVLTLDVPAARTLATHAALQQSDAPEAREALTEIFAVWREAGVAP